jgi:hypothetical protein
MPRQTTHQAQAVMASRMPERELQQLVSDLCEWLGLTHYHVINSKGMTPGLPDSIIIGGERVLWRELKSEHGRLTIEQRDAGDKLKAAGEDWRVWRPSDWISGVIEQELRLSKGQPQLPLEAS